MFYANGDGGFPFEGNAAGQHLVEDDAKAVEISAAVQLSRFGLLRTHVVGRADYRAGFGHLGLWVGIAGNAEVRDDRRAIAAKQNIFGFDIAMNKVLFVGIVEAGSDAAYDIYAVANGKALFHAGFQVAA